jgi:hypothetical protein
MANDPCEWMVAVNACPYCGWSMPEPTEEDYQLAFSGMGGAWSAEFGRITTGFWFPEDCLGCGQFLVGVEYQPELVRVEFRPEQLNELVFEFCVAWYGRASVSLAEPGATDITVRGRVSQGDSRTTQFT